jgi:hypothetical protein
MAAENRSARMGLGAATHNPAMLGINPLTMAIHYSEEADWRKRATSAVVSPARARQKSRTGGETKKSGERFPSVENSAEALENRPVSDISGGQKIEKL